MARALRVQELLACVRRERPKSITMLDASNIENGAVNGHLLLAQAHSRPQVARMAHQLKTLLRQTHSAQRVGQSMMRRTRNDDDAWQVVDAGDVVVSLAVEGVAKELGLEDHWMQLGAQFVLRDEFDSAHSDSGLATFEHLYSDSHKLEGTLIDESVFLETEDDLAPIRGPK